MINIKRYLSNLVAVAIMAASLTAPRPLFAAAGEDDPGAGLFLKKCMHCHTGILTGNDLQNTTIGTTESLHATVRRMQQHTGPMTDEQVALLVELLHDKQVKFRLEEAELMQNEADTRAVASAPQAGSTATTANWIAGGGATEADAPAVPAATGGGGIDAMALLFSKSCAGCHAIGTGAVLSGPDLASVADRPDKDVAAAVKRMESKVGPLTDEEVTGLVALLKDPAVKNRIANAEQQKLQTQTASMDPASTGTGEQLFHGTLAFANGGMACAACHTAGVQGGNMGPDLTTAFARLGASGIQSAAEQANFKVMKAAYQNHKVTPQEAIHLAAYLESIGAAPRSGSVPNIPLMGAVGAALMIGGLGMAFRKKNGGSARAKLIRRR